MKKLYRLRMSTDVIVLLDEEEVESHDQVHYMPSMGGIIKEFGKECGSGFIPTTAKLTQVKNAKNLPEGWDVGCIPFGGRRSPISRILEDIKIERKR